MNELLLSCTDTLDQPTTPACATDYGERVVKVIFAKEPIVNGVPSTSDFIDHADEITIFERIVNGHRIFVSQTEIEWHQKEWHDKVYAVEGRIRVIDSSIQRASEKVSRMQGVYMYFITDNSYCFGPYYTNPSFTLINSEGKGMPPYIYFSCKYIGFGADYSNKDDYDEAYLLHEDGLIIETEDGFLLIQE